MQSIEDKDLLQQALNTLQNWSEKWLLNFNIDEWQVVSDGRCTDKSFTYEIHDVSNNRSPLTKVEKIKDLGEWFDEKLSFKAHINYRIVRHTWRWVGIVKRSSAHLTIPTFVLLYNSMVRSHMDYCSSLLAPYRYRYSSYRKGTGKTYKDFTSSEEITIHGQVKSMQSYDSAL